MGLDIAFNRKAAIKAGMVVERQSCGTEIEIADAKRNFPEDTEYIEYLKQTCEVIRVPGSTLMENGGVDPDIVVRANKWGRNYEPLTQWLKANNIKWSEF